MSSPSVRDAFERAAEVGMRAVRRREQRRRLGLRVPTLPSLTKTVEVTDEWCRHTHGTLSTVDLPRVVMHAPEGDVSYMVIRRDRVRMRYVLQRCDAG